MDMKILSNILITLGISIAALGLIFFIINRAFMNKGYRTKFLVNLSLGLGLLILFIISLIVDYKGGNIFKFYYKHLILIIVSLGYCLVFTLSIYKTIQVSNIRIIKKLRINKEKNYLYILFKYREGYLLKAKKEYYQGYSLKMKSSFHDEAIEEAVKKIMPNYTSKVFKGKINSDDKLYFCYLVETNESLLGFEQISMYDLINLKTSDFDKEVILSIILKENFNITI